MIGLLALGLSACGDDDDEPDSSATTAEAEPTGPNVLTIKEKDYSYTIDGAAREGWLTLDIENTGKEFHEVGLAKLKAGKTIADVAMGLAEQGPPGGGDEATTTSVAGRGTSTSAGGGAGTTLPGGEEEKDPIAEFFEERYGTPGGFHQPGSRVKITTNKLDAGNYGVLCFIPTEGEGAPHFAKGMLASFEVKDVKTPAPEPTAASTAFTINKGKAPTGPTTLPAGDVTFKVTADTSKHEFDVVQFKPGKGVDDVDKFFTTMFGVGDEHAPPPPKGAAATAPTSFLTHLYDWDAGDTLYVTYTLRPGTYYIGCTFKENGDDDNPRNDVDHTAKELLKVTVT